MTPPQYDVAIIGFGPCGALAAALLGQQGHKVLVCEKQSGVYDKPRAIALDHEVMRTFQGLGIAEKILPHTAPFTPSEHFGADGQLIRKLTMLPEPYPMGWTPSMVFLQPPVEKILRQCASDQASVTVALSTELIALTQNSSGVTIELKSSENASTPTSTTAYAKYLIACDGASSQVRQLLDINLVDLDFDEPWLVVDVLANAAGLAKLPANSAQYCEPARPISYIVGTGSHRRWEIMLLPGEDPAKMLQPSTVWRLLSRWIAPEEGELWRTASYRFHALIAQQWRKNRVFLAGDAAHQQPPFLGQGMCQGARDATNLCWKLSHVLNGNAPENLLDTYGQERSAHVMDLTTTIKGIGLYICEQDPVLAKARDQQLIEKAGGTIRPEPRQDLIPKLKTGLFACAESIDKHPAHGSLFAQPRVHTMNGQELRLDDVIGGGWRLITSIDAADWPLSMPALTDLVEQLNLKVVRLSSSPRPSYLTESQDVAQRWFNAANCNAAIVRPDHYVYAVAENLLELEQYVNALRTVLDLSAS